MCSFCRYPTSNLMGSMDPSNANKSLTLVFAKIKWVSGSES